MFSFILACKDNFGKIYKVGESFRTSVPGRFEVSKCNCVEESSGIKKAKCKLQGPIGINVSDGFTYPQK